MLSKTDTSFWARVGLVFILWSLFLGNQSLLFGKEIPEQRKKKSTFVREKSNPMKHVTARFLHYTTFDTQSDELTRMTPSTPGQYLFGQELERELKRIGLSEVYLDNNGYLMATLPANTDVQAPVVGFIAHMDTSPDMSGRKVKARTVQNYQGGVVVLNDSLNVVLDPDIFPELTNYEGEDLIVTDGTTLLGADDKAGIAEIVTAMEYLLAHPEIKHGKIRICFTPDEEIGEGADHFDVAAFGADFAYTLDGGEIGELEYENFNAAEAVVTFHGRNVHPGYAKHKMLNSIRIANQYAIMLPRWETPEHTDGYEGFYHLCGFEGGVEKTTLTYLIRDHDADRFDRRKKELEHLVRKINHEFPDCAEIEIKDQYYNMREKIEPVMQIVDVAAEAMRACEVEPKVKAVRGGTDGARLSFEGLPCPNIFAGGHNFHGRYEFIPVSSMEKAVAVVVEIAQRVVQLTF